MKNNHIASLLTLSGRVIGGPGMRNKQIAFSLDNIRSRYWWASREAQTGCVFFYLDNLRSIYRWASGEGQTNCVFSETISGRIIGGPGVGNKRSAPFWGVRRISGRIIGGP